MKRILSILLALSALTAQQANAQTCPVSPTYTNQSGTFDLSSGRSIVLNNGKTFQITIQNNFSSTSSICVLNGSTVNLSFQNVNNMAKGGFINVDKNAVLTFPGSISNFPLTVINNGTTTQSSAFTFTDGATITNSGTYTINGNVTLNSGTITFSNTGNFKIGGALSCNSGVFSITNAVNSNFSIGGSMALANMSIKNSGTFDVGGAVTLQNASTVTNNSYMTLHGDANFSDATFANNGVLDIAGSTTVNTGSTLNNTCTITGKGNFSNNATVNNTGKLLLKGSLTNQGNFTNGSNGFVQGSDFTNNKSVTGGGNFYFSGNTTNQGTFAGTSGNNKINFYDASGSTKKDVFDVQNVKPSNTTQNAISPVTATSFSPCSDIMAPVITAQPATQYLCSSSLTETKFSVTATSSSTPAYQWYKNGTAVSGATASAYIVTGLTLADTANVYTVGVTNAAGTTPSNGVSVKYIIVSQPSPASLTLTTGNAASFNIKTSGATAWQWKKDGSNISGATAAAYTRPVVEYADSGKYTISVSYAGGTCTSDTAVLKTSVVMYPKSTGNLNQATTWGTATDGSGSTPIDFTREEHKFVVLNRGSVETGSDLIIAGTLDVANSKVVITPGTTLNAGRIIRSSVSTAAATGAIVGSATSNLTVHGITSTPFAGASDLYFDKNGNTLKNLIIAGHAVTLRSALNIVSGKKPGALQVNTGTFNTSDSLTLKSDSLGTAGIAKSAGVIAGKVTIEKWVHARRAWRFIGAPISSVDAPTIHDAWQEGAANSTDNPHPGFGTHITGGIEPAGFDKSPSGNPSIKYYTSAGAWSWLPNTKAIPVTQYPAFMLFVRGNRSYNILSTTSSTTPTTTVLRVTGNVYQGSLAAKTATANGFTMVINPYASPINFAKVVSASSNIKKRIRVWDPTMAGANGVGAWVTLDGTSGAYRATPPSANVSAILQAGQGFMIESGDGKKDGSLLINEDVKDFSVTTISGDREGEETIADTSLEVNLKVFNADNSTGIADGVLYRFSADANDSVDFDDAGKVMNFNENLGIREGSSILTIDKRTIPAPSDSLQLSLTGIKSTNYQLEFVPSSLQNNAFVLYDRYLNTTTNIQVADTTRYTFNVNTSVAASKASNRFVIVALKTKTVLPVTFTKIKAYLKDKAAQVEWNVQNELNITSYEVEKSTNGTSFTKAGTVTAKGATAYNFTDATPANGINYYRVKSIGKSGDVNYTGIVHVETEATTNPAVSVYPNPLTGTTFTLTLTNMTAGAYTLSVVTANGAVAFSKSITHNGGTASQIINLHNKLAAGIYYLTISTQNQKTSVLKVTAN